MAWRSARKKTALEGAWVEMYYQPEVDPQMVLPPSLQQEIAVVADLGRYISTPIHC